MENGVGLLDGEVEMAAMQMAVKRSSNFDSSRYWILGKEVTVHDTDSHFFFQPNERRESLPKRKGYSIQKREDVRADAFEVRPMDHMHSTLSYGPDVTVSSDTSHRNVILAQVSGTEVPDEFLSFLDV